MFDDRLDRVSFTRFVVEECLERSVGGHVK
jgi:hypothetical protein